MGSRWRRSNLLGRVLRRPAHLPVAAARYADYMLLLLCLAVMGAGDGGERQANGLRLIVTLVERHARLYSAAHRARTDRISAAAEHASGADYGGCLRPARRLRSVMNGRPAAGKKLRTIPIPRVAGN